jgi:hypothetical protein
MAAPDGAREGLDIKFDIYLLDEQATAQVPWGLLTLVPWFPVPPCVLESVDENRAFRLRKGTNVEIVPSTEDGRQLTMFCAISSADGKSSYHGKTYMHGIIDLNSGCTQGLLKTDNGPLDAGDPNPITFVGRGVVMEFHIYLKDDDPDTPWGLLTLRPFEPVDSPFRYVLEPADRNRVFRIREGTHLEVVPSSEDSIFVLTCAICGADGKSSYQGKTYMYGNIDVSKNTVDGFLKTMRDADDPNPIAFHGQKLPPPPLASKCIGVGEATKVTMS